MIIYIHGFGGSGEGSKAKAFRKYFNSIDETFIAPSLSYVPELAIKTLEELIDSHNRKVKLIGSSLGGYYTLYLAEKYDLPAVLINPSIHPDVTLSKTLGQAPNFYDESFFVWNEKHIEMLKQYRVKNPKVENLMLLVQKGDELLDYKESVGYLANAKQIVEEGGNHGFEGIERHFETIREFFAVGDHFFHRVRTSQFDMMHYKKHLAIALKAHADQKTPHGLPYAYHILSVAGEIISAIEADRLTIRQADVAIGCALLHDVLEDTDYDLKSDEIDDEIMLGVEALTKNFALPKEEQMADSLRRLKQLPDYIQMVKIADRITNLDPPPPHWDENKIRRYAEEATLIKDTLRNSKLFLWEKLDSKISEYTNTHLS